jgi:hypothetical protein
MAVRVGNQEVEDSHQLLVDCRVLLAGPHVVLNERLEGSLLALNLPRYRGGNQVKTEGAI